MEGPVPLHSSDVAKPENHAKEKEGLKGDLNSILDEPT